MVFDRADNIDELKTAHPAMNYNSVLITACIGAAISILIFVIVENSTRGWLKQQFEWVVQERVRAIENGFQETLYALDNIKGLFTSFGKISPKEFHYFTKGVLDRSEMIHALEWIPKVPHKLKNQFEVAGIKTGKNFFFKELAKDGKMVPVTKRDEYFPVYFMEPYKGNELALGFDLGSNKTRLATINIAMNSGKAAASQRVVLVQEKGDQFGLLLFLPVYKPAEPIKTKEQRQKHIMGFVLGVYRIGELIEKSISDFTDWGIDFEILDESASQKKRFLYASHGFVNQKNRENKQDRYLDLKQLLQSSVIFNVADRKWSFNATASNEFIDLHYSQQNSWYVLVTGFLLTFTLCAYLIKLKQHLLIRTSSDIALKNSKEYTDRVIASMINGMVVVDHYGIIQSVNNAACIMSGYDDENKLIGMPIDNILYVDTSDNGQVGNDGGVDLEPKNFEAQFIKVDSVQIPVMVSSSNLELAGEKHLSKVLVIKDISESKKNEIERRHNDERLQLALSAAELGVWQWECNTNLMILDKNINRILGLKRKASTMDRTLYLNRIHPDDVDQYVDSFNKAWQSNELFSCEYRIIDESGSERCLRDQGRMVSTSQWSSDYMLGVVVDITNHKHDRENLRVALIEKQTMLREMHHRVKNNLQIIASLFQLQSDDIKKRNMTTNAILAAMQDSYNRIHSMSLVHERLYSTENMDKIDFQSYVTSLTNDMFVAYGISKQQIKMVLDLEKASVDIGIELAIPCGLIINELISNSFKHAFPNNKKGSVCISLDIEKSSGMYELVVADSGIGFPGDYSLQSKKSLGLRLVVTLVKQIHGTIEFSGKKGAYYRVLFNGSG
ncbi:MAG: CHASE domain-containing protein [Magnetococcales bacterium]|nr:CHASE domain-containing protein [Magnetococcales bacterium]